MDSAQRDRFNRLLNLTHCMCQAAENKQWQELVDMEAERRNLLSEVFTSKLLDEDADFVRTCIDQVLVCDQKTAGLSEAGVKEVAANLSGIQKGRRAAVCYQGYDTDSVNP